ncbi:MAG: hypothetical protein COA50_02235 [Flavobacteriaceae bacterium]|nr:MAG: hypothetical protein COA50_02235 [Flavobacteriaceae bacterium]
MKRREVIKMVSLATGAAISAPLMSSLLSGCESAISKDDADHILQFFNENEFYQIREIVAVILPETDTPSASSIGVHRVIDTMVGTTYRPVEKETFKKTITSFLEYVSSTSGDKLTVLKELSQSNDESLADAKAGFLDLKQQTVAYYLLNEEIAKTQLNYLPVPGSYEPCIKLSDTNRKAWAI